MVYRTSTMQSECKSGLGDLEAQLASKEREWKELQAAKVHQLESSLKKAQEDCSSLRECYQQLREDFQFNLSILDERDRELERYDVTAAKALSLEHSRQEELSQLRMQVTKLVEQRAKETEEMQKELSKSQHRAAQHRLQLEKIKCSMAGEIQRQREEHERIKWGLQCQIQELEEKLSIQKQEMKAAFHSELRQQKHEFNLKMDEMRTVVQSHDLKVKLLSKETEVHLQAQLQATEALHASKEFCQQVETQLQQKEQEIKDLTAAKDCIIKELEDKLKWMGTKLKMKEGDYIKKYEDVVQALEGFGAQLEAQCQAHTEQLQNAEKHIVKLQENVEVLTAQAHCIQEYQQAIKKKDETIESLRRELEATRTGWDEYIREVSSKMVSKDTETISLQQRETQLRTEQERSREEMEGYKQQLSAGLRRELALEQMLVKVDLEWQRCCENIKAEHYLANELLIQDLTQARDQAKAELKDKGQELHDVTTQLHCVKTERDQVIQGLKPKVDCLASEEIHHLQEQNSILRAMVTQMRKDIESLNHLLPHSQTQPQTSSAQAVHHQEAPASTSAASIANSQTAEGGLCLEKYASTSALMKQKVGVAHTKPALASIIKQSALVQQKQAILQEENVHGAKSNPSLLHIRLKQAALCISRLSREKQQLIEMGNRLRAQIMRATLQEPVEQERDSSTKKQGDLHDRLSALEQLQYQLTTQELHFAQRQGACSFVEQRLPGNKNRVPATEGAANRVPQEHKITDRPDVTSSRNNEDTPLHSWSQSSRDMEPQPHSGLSRSWLSSEESLRSLKELWEILDHGLSPSVFSEGELSRREVEESGAGVELMVHGISAPFHSHPPTEVQPRRNPPTMPSNIKKSSRLGTPGRIRKIRNYNVKD